MNEDADVKMQRTLLHDLITCIHGDPRSLAFEQAYRNCYYLCRSGGARRVELVLTYVGRLLAHMRAETADERMKPVEDICLYYHNVYASKRGPPQYGAFWGVHKLYTEAVEERRQWAIYVCARTRRRAWARTIFDKYLYDGAMRRLGKPGGFYERRALASGRWGAAAAAPEEATGKKRPRN